MTEPSEEVKAMARRILSECEGDPTWKAASLRGERDHTRSFKIALAAILETQRLDLEYLESVAARSSDHTKIAAIRTGTHYGKAEQ